MELFLFNISWMVFNLYLAALPVVFAWFLFKMPNKFFTFIVGVLWLLYLPNTIYVFTDLHHLIEQWSMVDGGGKLILILQYTILEVVGLTCFLVALYPAEIILSKINSLKSYQTYVLIAINLFFGLLMSLGKFERVNSWDVFIDPQFFISSCFYFLQSFDLIGIGILFGLFANFFYFLLRKKVKIYYDRWFI